MSLVNDHWMAKVCGERLKRALFKRRRRLRNYLCWPPLRRCRACKRVRLIGRFYKNDPICRYCWDYLWAATFK